MAVFIWNMSNSIWKMLLEFLQHTSNLYTHGRSSEAIHMQRLMNDAVFQEHASLFKRQTRKSSCGKSQEAYRPRRNLSKCNLSQGYLSPGQGSTPSGPDLEVPHPDLAGGIPQFWPGGYPILTWMGGSPSRVHIPHRGLGYHPAQGRNLGPVTAGTSPERNGTSGSIMGWIWGTSPADRQIPVKTLPSRMPLGLRAVTRLWPVSVTERV